MSEIRLAIPYKNAVTNEGRVFAWALWPIWVVLAPLTLLITLVLVAAYPAIFPPVLTAALLGGSALLFASGALFTAVAQDNHLYVSKEGLYLPTIMMLSAGTKYLPWDRIVSADVTERRNGKVLQLVLKGAKRIEVPLHDLPDEQLEQLFVALELWGDRCERAPLLVAYQHEVQNAVKGIERVSYTQMWERELSRRFSTTAFIPLEPGTALRGGKFKVVRQLSFGGFSAIYLVQDELGKFVVAKEAVVPASAGEKQKEKAQEHFQREASILTRLNHGSITRVFDHFTENARNYLLLEYIEGQNLRQFVNANGPIDNERARKWAIEIADIIDHLHSFDPPVIHRDLSPDNLMLQPDMHLKLIDFGAANHLVSEATGTLVGKQAYMAAEQLRGKAGKASDYYGFGGTLYFLLTGSDPIPLQASAPSTLNNAVSSKLDALIMRLMAFEPNQRVAGFEGKNLRDIVEACL